jgi:hypothetical protein
MLRFLLLRVLPRRLFPILLIFEIVRFVRNRKRRNDADAVPTQAP